MNVLQPIRDLETIKKRLDVVEELTENEEMLFAVTSSLSSLPDLDSIIADIIRLPARQMTHHTESKINQVIMLKSVLQSLKNVEKCLENAKSSLLLEINEVVSDKKLSMLSEDASRQAYKETVEDVYERANEYCETTGLQLKLQFSSSKGFFLSLSTNTLDKKPELSPCFINIGKTRKQWSLTTLELLIKVHSVVTSILEAIRNDVSLLYKVSEAIGMLDMLSSFAYKCTTSKNYGTLVTKVGGGLNTGLVRPDFTQTLAIKSGRNPILDTISTDDVIPNDTYASLASSFQLITGPNMSGKTTYLKQIALLTVMAHIGSFVPAEYGSFRSPDQILSRLTNDSRVEIGISSFVAEMTEAAYILKNATAVSLVIVDELGRGKFDEEKETRD
ncbi:MutS protein msh4 [Apophysomyces ossiformis]|uniref:MutS protein msh4 n=1 Tax=Apophysomyces ossiformis TaxID=679940 RepID=A0A8H7EP54_9FUNG|nr:MutS protein msh4 [Apophysomyces ossiformis]